MSCFSLFESHRVTGDRYHITDLSSYHAVGYSLLEIYTASDPIKQNRLEKPAQPLDPFLFIQDMGNSHSGRSRTSGTRNHLYTRKPSVLFSRISLGCGTGSSIHSSENSIESSKLVFNEKFVQGDDIESQKQSLLAYTPTLVNLDENGEVAFQEFLKHYPGDHYSSAIILTLTPLSIRISIDMDSRYASPN